MRVSRLAASALCAASTLATALYAPVSAALPEFHNYQVPLGTPQADFTAAFNSIKDRRQAVIDWNACAEEVEFLAQEGKRKFDEGSEEHNKREGGIYHLVLAKVLWLTNRTEARCEQTLRVYAEHVAAYAGWPLTTKEGLNHIDAQIGRWPAHAGFDDGDGRALLNAAFDRRFGGECKDSLKSVTKVTLPDQVVAYDLTFSVTRACMIEEVNRALLSRVQVGHPGTDALPCRVVGKAGKGDWDMAVISLLRIVNSDTNTRFPVLRQETKDHIFNNLLTISGDLEPESYGLFQCGNTERDTGSAQDRADERAFYNDGNFFDDLGDLFDWFMNFFLVAGIVVAGLLFLYGPGLAALAAAVATAGAVTMSLAQFRIPETENHLLMINTSRFLTNQMIINSLADKDDKEWFEEDQEEIREWLLQRMQRITSEDFIEYNSKPYQRLSIAAILNIYDFADPDEVKLRRAANIVLDFASAKYAAGSNQARRLVPFRRLMEVNRHEIWGPSDEGLVPRRLFELGDGSDAQAAAMLFFTGQLHQLPRKMPAAETRFASRGSVGQMMWQASSKYVPDSVILDLAINKQVPYEQRIRHDGVEIYSSGKGYLITAGGIRTDYAYGALLTPIQIPTGVPFNVFLKNSDRGAAVPTTLMAASNEMAVRREDFLRIEGPLIEWNHEDRDEDFSINAQCELDPAKARESGCKRNVTHDFNVCVRKGFACGTHIRVPPGIEDTCLDAPAGAPSEWKFINSESCPAYQGAPPFYVVLFRRACPANEEYCKGEWGFFEVVDKPAGMSFQQFMEQTIARNPLSLLPLADSMVGNYRSWRNERLQFSALGNDEDSDSTGITGVNDIDDDFVEGLGDIDDWPLAAGDALTADGQGRLTIRSPAWTTRRIEIDFTDWENPKWQVIP